MAEAFSSGMNVGYQSDFRLTGKPAAVLHRFSAAENKLAFPIKFVENRSSPVNGQLRSPPESVGTSKPFSIRRKPPPLVRV